jgi:hypothetical protein
VSVSAHQEGILETVDMFLGLYSQVPFRNQSLALRMQGALNTDVLHHCIDTIVARHEVLRTTFPIVDGRRTVRVAPPARVPLTQIDLRELEPARHLAEVEQVTAADAAVPLDLKHGPLLAFKLFRLAHHDFVLVALIDHILFDGWSFGVFIHELAESYAARLEGREPRLPELPIQYADFAHWEHSQLESAALRPAWRHWRTQLATLPTAVDLPTDAPRRSPQPFTLGRLPFQLSTAAANQAVAFARSANCSLFKVLLSAFNIALWRQSDCTDISVIAPMANRQRAEVQGLIGGFSNGVALRTDLSGDPSFLDLTARVRRVVEGALAAQGLPFGHVLRTLLPDSDPFRVYFMLQNFPVPPLELPGLSLRVLDINYGTTLWDLTVAHAEVDGTLGGPVCYNSELFSGASVRAFLHCYETALLLATAEPRARISRVGEKLG